MTFIKKFWVSFFLFFLLFALQIGIGSRHSFVADPLVKAVQIKSFINSKFQSETVIYPAIDLDPDASLQPLPEGFIFPNKDRIIGVFPFFFTILYSIFFFIPAQFLPYLNSLFLFLLLFFLQKNLELSSKSLFLFSLGTVIFPQLFDLSENPIFFLLTGISFIFCYKYLQDDRQSQLLVGSLFAGLAIWLRFEALLFFTILYTLIAWNQIYNFGIISLRKILSAGFLFLFLFISFLVFNFMNYGHYLGPRYTFNYTGVSGYNWNDRFFIFLDIVFTSWKTGVPSLGFFFYCPLLLFAMVMSGKRFYLLNKPEKILFIFIILFVPAIGLTAPNSGFTVTGRYMSLATFPIIILLEKIIQSPTKWEIYFIRFGYAWTVLMFFLVLVILKFAFNQSKIFHNYYTSVPTTNWVFSTRLLSGSVSLEYFNKKIISIEKEENLVEWKSILDKHDLKSFTLFAMENSKAKNLNLFNPYTSILEISKNAGYNCLPEEGFKEILRFDCKK